MGINAQPEYDLTLEEYLAIEQYANIKHEYIDGAVYAMAGGSGRHGLIAARLIRLTGLHGRKGCEAFTSDLKVYIEQLNIAYYPDVSIVCGRPRYHDEGSLLLVNPVAIFEVLSPSTARLDRGSKAQHYQLIPSLKDYLIVSPDEPRIEHYERDPDGGLWSRKEVEWMDGETFMSSCDCRLSLAELYEPI